MPSLHRCSSRLSEAEQTASLFNAFPWAESRCSEHGKVSALFAQPHSPTAWDTRVDNRAASIWAAARWVEQQESCISPRVLEGSLLKHAGSRGLSSKSSGNLRDLYLGAAEELASLEYRAMEGSFKLCLCLWEGGIDRGPQIVCRRAESSLQPARHPSVEHG